MVQRQPADDHVVRIDVDAETVADQLFVGDQIAVADLYAFGQCGGAGGVLQEGDVICRQRRLAPVLRQRLVEAVDAQQRRRTFDLLQGLAQIGAGQQQARFGIGNDRQQAFLMMTPCRFRRIGRHCDHAGVEAPKKRRDVIRAAGKQQHRAVA